MYKEIKISIYINIINLLSLISAAYLEAESNYVKPKLERNNIVNKGLWIRNNRDRKYANDFIFRANSLDEDNVLQNNFDAFRQNIANSAFSSGYNNMERGKRSPKDKSKLISANKVKCINKYDCPNVEDKSLRESKIISTLKPASILNDYPYEIAVLLNNKKHPQAERDISEEDVDIYNKDGIEGKKNYKKVIIQHNIKKDNSSTIKDNNNLTNIIFPTGKSNKSHANKSSTIPKRSISQREYESELIKKIEFIEDDNSTDINKIDRNILDKEEMAWHNAPTPNINVYKILPKKIENVRNKPINERGLLKVLSMLTRTFKKIMKQHQDIKRIHNNLYDLNDEFTKNAELLTSKFEDFNSKYLFMVNLNEELKIMEAKFKGQEQRFNNREKDLVKNLREFEDQQKQFLAQQRQFYKVQKLMLAQNEKINLKQNLITKTQNEISHRQNNFARILKKAKQIYIDSRKLIPTKLNTATAKPKVKPAAEKVEPVRIVYTTSSTTTTTLPPPIPTTETVKINLFSVPALTRLENQDQMILDEKDYQPVDELIYKYYFNNTFIDDLMKNKILATFLADSEDTENSIAKNKRTKISKHKSTLLLPVNKTIESKKQRNRRWIKYSKKNNHIKGTTTPVIINEVPDIKENIVNTGDLKIDLTKKVDAFTTMALNFCKEIGQNVNLQVLNWCVEKALRRLKIIDLKISPLLATSPFTLSATIPQISQKEEKILLTESSPTLEPQTQDVQNIGTTEDINTVMFFPDNDELENKLKEYELKPDTEGTVYYDGSLHASDLARIGDADSGGFSDIMPGQDSNSRVQVDPMAFDLQAQRRTSVKKVFCVTLLAVAFTFTVILTNVFVDIDGLLANKKKYIPETSPIPETFVNDKESLMADRKQLMSNEDRNYDSEINQSYRTKRSIASETIYQAKNPTVKKMLTRRLANLLEELDKEEAKKEEKLETTSTKADVTKNEENPVQGIRNENLLQLIMHNILLQGLIGHMDLNDVYKKVHELMQTFSKRIDSKSPQDEKLNVFRSIVNSKNILKDIPDFVKDNNYNEEYKFFNELIKCKELEKQIARTSLSNEINATNENQKDENVSIKTVIEINENDNGPGASNISHPKENVEALIKLIYNGKSIKVNQMHDEIKTQKTNKSKTIHEIEKQSIINNDNKITAEPNNMKQNTTKNRRHQPSPFLNKVLEDLKKRSFPTYEYLQNNAEVKSIKTQRLKRQIKIRYSDNVTSSKIKPVHEGVKKDGDDLYIEIETHFDGKGIKGEKKKKLVRSLIDKIQKALDSDIEEKGNSVEHIKFVKRTQDPITSQDKFSLKTEKPLELIEQRVLDPIGKTLEYHEKITDRLGDKWKKQYYGPNFLSKSKAVNSAEMNEVNIDYDRVLTNGISKRFQTPLNIEVEDDGDTTGLLNPDSGNVTLFLKDIDGSGFSIGFNQYEGEPPDRNSMKMFNGLENLIREYHKTYDQDDNINNESPANESPVNKVNNFVETYHEIAKRSVEDLHKLELRNSQNIANNFLYDTNYNDIHLSTNLSLKEVPIIVDERILNEKLKSSEIFSIANVVNRKRRSVNVKKISNLKSKIKLNRYLNTKTMTNKKVFIKNKRNKRHVNNIRIVERDRPQSKPSQKNSDENIFFISKENSYIDQETMIRNVESGDTKTNYKNTEYNIDEESPFSNIYRIQNPNIQDDFTESVYNTAIRSNGLMSKYPHIFLDKDTSSREEIYFDEKQYRTDRPYRIEASSVAAIEKQIIGVTTENNIATVLQDLSVPKVQEMVSALIPPLPGTNYRISVKMSPKNKTNTNAGFKEVHTSVNKSYDDNGVRYSTLLKLSQISKIEKLNNTDEIRDVAQPLSDHLTDQQKEINALLKLHKKRVDLQLNSLLRESNHLEEMIEPNKNYNIDKKIKLLLGDDSRIDTTNEEKLMNVERKRQEMHMNQPKHLITTPTTSKPVKTTTETAVIDKSKIIETLKQSEKMTFEILRKIDTNTQILQTFLQKFSENFALDKNQHTTIIKPTEKSGLEMKLDLSKDWKSYGGNKGAFFPPKEYRNDTIPFVYAYQQSIPMKNNSPSQSLASLIYHGHIHTNDVQNSNTNNFKKPINLNHKIEHKLEPNILVNTDNSKRRFNESKFFSDGINNFEVIPSKDRVISTNIKINATNIL
ncbi:metacaspase-2-like [Maniola jurtina]|uniref:metacaspase-2-like n=1 Tax=Maniola jurtina TaxID=191418 RepID=UPI001E68A62A|nr:metacaspase-2-like [Maniola jurtina]